MRRLLFVVVAVVSAAHLYYAAKLRTTQTPDSPQYTRAARNLLEKRAFVDREPLAYSHDGEYPDSALVPITGRTPGYPAFLAALFAMGANLRAIVLVQHVMVIAFAAWMFHFLAREIGEAAAAIAAILYGAWPAVVLSAGVIMTETLGAILTAIALGIFYLSLRRDHAWLMAVAWLLLGIATLTRPVTLYLPLVLIVVALARRRVKVAVVFAIASALLPVLWAARNKAASGVAVVSSVEGENLLMFRGAGTLVVKEMPTTTAIFALQRQSGFLAPALRLRKKLGRETIAEAARDGVPLTHARLSRYYGRKGMDILRRHPLDYAKLAISGVIALYFDHFASWSAAQGMHYIDARIRFVPVSVILVALAVFGLVTLYRRNAEAGITLIAVLFYFTAVSAGPEVEDVRFIVPFVAMYAVAIAAGAAEVVRRARQGR